MQYKPGDCFLRQCMYDVQDYGVCAVETTDTPDYCLMERIPPSIILGGWYAEVRG